MEHQMDQMKNIIYMLMVPGYARGFKCINLKSPSFTILASDPIIQIARPIKSTKYNYISTVNPKLYHKYIWNYYKFIWNKDNWDQDGRLLIDFFIKPCLFFKYNILYNII